MADQGTPAPKPLTVQTGPAAGAGGGGLASPGVPPSASTPVAPSFPPPSTSTGPSPPSSAPRSSIAVGLHEAALDSPSFRASAHLFGEQVESLERWLDSYAKSTSKLVHDFADLEETINSYLTKIVPPPGAADGLIDADHTLVALKRVSDGTREWWTHITQALRRVDAINADPVRAFLANDIRTFKETRRTLEQAQKTYDSTLARYVSQSKTKEPSSLREDAFSVYETRRAYLKASMDFCQLAPQLRTNLDKLLTRTAADFWRDMKRTRETAAGSVKWGDEMDRVRGWSKDLELSEGALRRELQLARRTIGESTLAAIKPSRELDDYSASTVPYLGSRGPSANAIRPSGSGGASDGAVISEKQGWLFLRTSTGKPARVNWVHRWFYCRDGIFGYLMQGPQGVLQGDDIGVLLCSAKPAVQEERRFCFEVKTKSQTLTLQAETQGQLTEWLEVFEVAKRKAFEASMGRDNAVDPAFSITAPSVPDFSVRSLDAASLGTVDEGAVAAPVPLAHAHTHAHTHAPLTTTSTLPVPGSGPGPDTGLMTRSSIDVGPAGPPRRSITTLGQELRREEGESRGEHASRLIQRLDLHRKATTGSAMGSATGHDPFGAVSAGGSAASSPVAGPGGIAGMMASTHGALPGMAGGSTSGTQRPHLPTLALGDPRRGSLAPTTFAKAPVLTFLSRVAVHVSSERILCRPGSSILPAGIQANYWGTQQWGTGFVSRGASFNSPELRAYENTGSLGSGGVSPGPGTPGPGTPSSGTPSSGTPGGHRKTLSVDAAKAMNAEAGDRAHPEVFPPHYPAELRLQHAQFRLLFPAVPLEEKLVLVFNAAWTSAAESGEANDGLVGSGRVYVTPDNMYFYSQTMGLVVAYAINLDLITEVTAAPGKDCDYTFLHLSDDANETGFTRITIKTFTEDMYILQARLNLLIDDLQAAEPMGVPEILVALQNMVADDGDYGASPSVGSPPVLGPGSGRLPPTQRPLNPRYRGLYQTEQTEGTDQATGRRVTSQGSRGSGVRPFPAFQNKLTLPSHPVVYEPSDMQKKVAERHFEISAKACFHVLFGDKSFIFAKLYFDRQAVDIEQGPWVLADHGTMRRQFSFVAETADLLGRKKLETVVDEQRIDLFSDHVTYEVTYTKTAWHLPHAAAFRQVTKVVVTHMAKSKCKLAVFVRVDWTKAPAFSAFSRSMVDRQALDDASREAEELAEVATDEVRKLGAHSRTKRAIQVYGNIGAQTKAVLFSPAEHGVLSTKQQMRTQPRTLGAMLFEVLRSFMESVVTSLVMWTFAGARSLFRAASAHRVLLLVLGLSVATNLLFSSRETSAWWAERHAAQYMGKLGVGPNVAMSRSLYLADLEAAVQPPLLFNETAPSTCYDAYRAVADATDLDADADAAAALLSPVSRATARRVRQSRQRLAAYRHDLVVAMRVVNRVEADMVHAEWANWLAGETWRCAQMGDLLARGQTEHPGDSEDVRRARIEVLTHWHRDYCGSCHADQQALDRARAHESLV